MKQIKVINPDRVTAKDAEGYSLREAARAVLFDEDKKIALLHVSKDGYYKLPGGGLDPNEDPKDGLERECLEELGCSVQVISEIGTALEYWGRIKEKQTSYCFLAKVKGEKGTPNFTEKEISKSFAPVWLSYKDALKVLRECKPTSNEADYIVPRDLAFLEAAESAFAKAS